MLTRDTKQRFFRRGVNPSKKQKPAPNNGISVFFVAVIIKNFIMFKDFIPMSNELANL